MRVLIAALFCLAAASAAFAHGVHAEARLHEGWVVFTMSFHDDARPKGATVTAYRIDGETQTEVATGVTDARGTFRFRPKAAGRYRLQAVEASGHRASASVTIEAWALTAGVTSQTGGSTATAPDGHGHGHEHGHEHGHGHGHGQDDDHDAHLPWAVLGGLLLIGLLSFGLSRWQGRSQE